MQGSAPRRRLASLLFIAPLAIALCLTACGGGGGGGGDEEPDGPALLGLFRAFLRGDNEIPVTDPDARSWAVMEIYDDGTIVHTTVVEPEWADRVNMYHIHRGDSTVASGPIEVHMMMMNPGGDAFNTATGVLSKTIQATPALAAEIAAQPSQFYLNVHTFEDPNGFTRGQIEPFTFDEFHALLLGTNEEVVVDPAARGAAAMTVNNDRTVDYTLAMFTPAASTITGATIHDATGAQVVDLAPGTATLNNPDNTLTGEFEISIEGIARLMANPGAFTVRVRTAAAPSGVASGPAEDGPEDFWAVMSGAHEVPPIDPLAAGGLTIRFDSFTSGLAMLAVSPGNAIEDLTAANIHEGPFGVSGDAVIDLLAGADYATSPAIRSSEGSVTLNRDLYARILAAPQNFHANYMTQLAQTGLVRGQLTQDPLTFSANLRGDEEGTIEDPDASGAAKVIFTSMFTLDTVVALTRPSTDEVMMAHIHDGPLAVKTGPILINLLGGTFSQNERAINGTTEFTGRTFSRIIAAPDQFYVNVHTMAAPDGIARGQLALVTSDTPPTSVQYLTPVVFETGLAVEENVPLTFGGAVQSFSIQPGLPAGLAIHALTGAIYGMPTEALPPTDFTVTATNQAGSAIGTVNIEVIDGAPAGLAYSTPVNYTVGVTITPNTPTSTGGTITGYTVFPALPTGLTLNATTGVISGIPQAPSPSTNYTITGSNLSGSTQAVVNITVVNAQQPPTNLSYTSPVSYNVGVTITPNVPSVSGGAVANWSVSPALPPGLVLDSVTGRIMGTPTQAAAAANYTVTASNGAGQTQAVVNITVVLGKPETISYSPSLLIGYVKTSASMKPSFTGGTPDNWTISPALPQGLSINSSTGEIAGTPSASSPQTNYTVTASNASGSAQTTVTIIVY